MFRLVRVVSTERIPLKFRNAPTQKLYRPIYRHYATREICPPPPKKKSPYTTGTLYTLGALVLVGGATAAYAKYDECFRRDLIDKAPFLDPVLKVVLLEESLLDEMHKAYCALKTLVFNLIFDEEKKGGEKPCGELTPPEYRPPSPIIPSLEEPCPPPEKFSEIRTQCITDEGELQEEIGGVKKPEVEELPETHPKILADLEEQLCESAALAVNAYNKAIFNLKRYNSEVDTIIEMSVERINPKTWEEIREKSKEKDESIQDAHRKAETAKKNINKMKDLVSSADFEAPESTREVLLNNIRKIHEDIIGAQRDLENEIRLGSIANKYWDRVKEARQHFAEELEALFPSIDLSKKQLSISGDDLDLFLSHAYSHVLYYQKELAKLETIQQQRLQSAVDAARRGGGEALTDAQICDALEQEKRKLQLCFQKQCLKLRKDSENQLREQLKRQSQAFADHLAEAMQLKEKEVDRGLARKFDEQLDEERCRYKMQLAAIIGRLRGLDQAMKIRAEADRIAKQSQVLWAACQTLIRALRSTCPGLPWQTQLRPLNAELVNVQKAAAAGDELVAAVIQGIPKEAKERGVFPEDALRERFFTVEKVARRVALVPEEGARLPIYILSYIQSLLLINAPSPIPQAELNDDVIDFTTLGTNDILQRARYWLDRGDFMQALKYMNLLRGAPRSVARQWMNETRILLETQQAAQTLMAHAAASGLMYL